MLGMTKNPHHQTMNKRVVLALTLVVASCRPVNQLDRRTVATVPSGAFTVVEALRVADQYRVAGITNRRINHADYWSVLQPVLVSPRLHVEEIGKSMMGRPLRAITFGNGPTKVLLWSQMHGDEATATMALADILSWMTAGGNSPVRDRMASALTVVLIPMLNTDGAE